MGTIIMPWLWRESPNLMKWFLEPVAEPTDIRAGWNMVIPRSSQGRPFEYPSMHGSEGQRANSQDWLTLQLLPCWHARTAHTLYTAIKAHTLTDLWPTSDISKAHSIREILTMLWQDCAVKYTSNVKWDQSLLWWWTIFPRDTEWSTEADWLWAFHPLAS